MDTPTIAQYYQSYEPMKRKELLEESIRLGEDPEENEIRQRLWELRYSQKSDADPSSRADAFLGLWMVMEFNKSSGNRIFGGRGARREIAKQLEKLKFGEYANGSALEQELFYREVCHLVTTYIALCEEDKTYNSTLLGLMAMKKESALAKLQNDIYETAIVLPFNIGMEKEMELIIRAAREVYQKKYPGEGGLPAAPAKRK